MKLMDRSSPEINIISTFLQVAVQYPERVALLQDGKQVTYNALAEEVKTCASDYSKLGISKGDMVLVFVPMSLELYKVVLALFYLGACPVFLDEWVSLARLKECLKLVPCKAMIAKQTYLFLAFFIKQLHKIPVKLAADRRCVASDKAQPVTSVSGSDTALVTFTTGSTGIPKAANRTHDYLAAQLQALAPLLRDVASPCMTMLPIVVLLHLASGKTAILPPRKFKAKKTGTVSGLLEALISSQSQALIASPAIVARLIEAARHASMQKKSEAAFSGMKTVITGGGPVDPLLAEAMLTAFPKAAITAVYGSTEAEPIAHISAGELAAAKTAELIARGIPLGKPDEVAEVAILDPAADSTQIYDESVLRQHLMPSNTPGEIIVAGPHVLQHYINNPAAEAVTKIRTSEKVWHRTGDCGLLDEHQKLFLLGRCNEVVDWQGRQFYPYVISMQLRLQAGVSESVLIKHRGQLLLILEEQDRARLITAKELLPSLHLDSASIQLVRKIPRDPRHQTKVDMERLRREI